MNMIKNDHWFIHDNELAILLNRYYASISLSNDDGKVFFILKVANGVGGKEINLSFSSLEKAMVFTEDVVDKCNSFDEIKTIYYDTLYDNSNVYRKVR